MSILLEPTKDGGNYDVSINDIALDFSLYSLVYISLFGGNIEASTQKTPPPSYEISGDYWGNVYNSDPMNQFNSATERVLIEVPANTAGLLKYERAAIEDLQWLKSKNLAKTVMATASILSPHRVQLIINIDGNDIFAIAWDQTKKTVEKLI